MFRPFGGFLRCPGHRVAQHQRLFSESRAPDCPEDSSNLSSLLTRLCSERYYMSPEAFSGRSSSYGPLGAELKRNLTEQWSSAVRSRALVFGISTAALGSKDHEPTTKVINSQALQETLRTASSTAGETSRKIQELLRDSASFRTSLLPGALQQYKQMLELVNGSLPFGLTEIGLCHRFDDQLPPLTGCSSEVTHSSLVWFCSPRTSSQWMDYWAHQRLQWWRKLAVNPSDFNLCSMEDEVDKQRANQGLKIMYNFPWGTTTLETLWSLGDAPLLKMYPETPSKIQCRDGRKSVVPHIISISADLDRGMQAFLVNSLQLHTHSESKQKLHQRTVLKLHAALTPVKVALDVGQGPISELRQVCQGLLQEFLEAGISSWPGFLATTPVSLESLHSKYDEMGVLFTVMVSESTIKSGLLLVRNRDTTIGETMHISEIKSFLLTYISASNNL